MNKNDARGAEAASHPTTVQRRESTPNPPGVQLQYADPHTDNTRTWSASWFALQCGLVPLVLGIADLIGFLLTGSDFFQICGLFVLAIGVPINVIGILGLLYGLYHVWRRRQPLDRAARRRVAVAAAVLVLNYPAAYLCVQVGTWASSRHTFVIRNGTSTTCDSFVIVANGTPHEVGPIEPGGSKNFGFRPTQDGSVTFRSRLGSTSNSGDLVAYVSSGPMGDDHQVTIQADGSVKIR